MSKKNRKNYNYFKPEYDGLWLSWMAVFLLIPMAIFLLLALSRCEENFFHLGQRDFYELASATSSVIGSIWLCCGVLLNNNDKQELLKSDSYNKNVNIITNAILSASRTVKVGVAYFIFSFIILVFSKFQ